MTTTAMRELETSPAPIDAGIRGSEKRHISHRHSRYPSNYATLVAAQKQRQQIAEQARAAAHGLRNGVTIIKAYAQLTRKALDNQNMKLANDASDGVIRGADKLSKQISREVDSFSIWQEPSPESISIGTFIQTFIDEETDPLQTKVELTNGLPGESACIYADPRQLLTIFRTLYTNSCHAGSNMITLSCETKEGYGIIYFEDNGKGMSAATQLRCFDPYFTTKKGTGQEGSGIGLAEAKKFAQKNNGKVELIWSKEGFGTRFALAIPLAN